MGDSALAVVPRLPLLIANGFFPVFPLPVDGIRSFLSGTNRPVAVVPYRLSDMCDIVDYSDSVFREAVDLARSTSSPCIDILGFSMGGLAALYAVKRRGLSAVVRKLVAYGSPFQGLHTAALLLPGGIYAKTGLQMLPGSHFMRELHDREIPSGTEVVSLGGKYDLICPASRTLLLGATCRTLPYGHSSFLMDRNLFAAIERFLR